MREMSVAEQRYKAVMAVISEGRTITQVAPDWDVSRQTMHAWLARYEADGLEGLATTTSGTGRRHTVSCFPHARFPPWPDGAASLALLSWPEEAKSSRPAHCLGCRRRRQDEAQFTACLTDCFVGGSPR